MTKAISCPYCACDQASPSFGREEDPMLICQTCRAWYVYPFRTAEEMASFYAENADLGIGEDLREWREGTSQWKWYAFLASRVSAIARQKLEGDPQLHVADIGAGGLELSLELLKRFKNSKVKAFDLHDLSQNPCSDRYADRISFGILDLNRWDQTDVESLKSKFDLVVCISVIEHVIDPFRLMEFLFEITNSQGLVYIVGPNSESPAFRLLGKKWPYYTPDQHLTIPSAQSLAIAIERIAPGSTFQFRSLRVRYSLRYLMNYLGISVSIPRALDFALPLPTGAFELVWRKC